MTAMTVMDMVHNECEVLYARARETARDPQVVERLIEAHKALIEARWLNTGMTIDLTRNITVACSSIASALAPGTMIGVGLHKDD